MVRGALWRSGGAALLRALETPAPSTCGAVACVPRVLDNASPTEDGTGRTDAGFASGPGVQPMRQHAHPFSSHPISSAWVASSNTALAPTTPIPPSALCRAYSSSASSVKAAEPPASPVFAVAGVTEATPADDDPHSGMTPKAVVELLDRYIIGQDDAKRAVAVAYRNRWRRKRVPASIRDDIVPKNILLIGPTGCGKTEIARRLAKLANSPFVKVEATKFTEVGYHGRDVDTIIRDLLEAAIGLVRQRLRRQHEAALRAVVEERLLRALHSQEQLGAAGQPAVVEALREKLRKGELEDVYIEVDLTPPPGARGGGGAGGPGIIDLGGFGMGSPQTPVVINLTNLGGKKDVRTLKVREARPLLEDLEAERMFPPEQLIKEAIAATEQDGIVFIDEIDKIVSGGRGPGSWRSGDPSSEGVQRDLLPIIEGSVVSTKHGNVSTDHILFICAGAFHSVKPSDLMAELQGRLPIRVELRPLSRADFLRILTEPEYNLIRQQKVLLSSEGVDLEFSPGALDEVTRVAEELNRSLDNIGARRLHAVLERVVEEISFDAPELVARAREQAGAEGQQAQAGTAAGAGTTPVAEAQSSAAAVSSGGTAEGAQQAGAAGSGAGPDSPAAAPGRVKVVIDRAHVERTLSALLQKQDLTRYIL